MESILAIWNTVPESLQTLLVIIIKIVVIVVPIMLSVAYLTLAERKVIAYIQVRIGPNRVGPRGFLQPIAELGLPVTVVMRDKQRGLVPAIAEVFSGAK